MFETQDLSSLEGMLCNRSETVSEAEDFLKGIKRAVQDYYMRAQREARLKDRYLDPKSGNGVEVMYSKLRHYLRHLEHSAVMIKLLPPKQHRRGCPETLEVAESCSPDREGLVSNRR